MIAGGVPASSGIPFVDVPQLHLEHGPLDPFHTGVETDLDVVVPAVLGVIAKTTVNTGSIRISAPPTRNSNTANQPCRAPWQWFASAVRLRGKRLLQWLRSAAGVPGN